MIIKRIKYSIVLLVIFFSYANLAYAEVIFNEIAWKGTATSGTHEWIELSGASGENISGWIISDGIGQLNIVIPENSIIPNTGFYVIKRTTSDITPYNLSTTFSGGLSDGGEKLILSDSSGEIKQTLDFSSGWPDTKMTSSQTMQWNGSSWITASPTPGAINSGVSNTSSSDNSSSSTTTAETTDTVSTTKDEPKVYKISTKIVAPKIVTAGVPFFIDHTTTGLSKEKVILGKFIWNFGDGMKKERSTSDPFEYIYEYPGEYVLSLSYSDSPFDTKPDAMDRLTIKVIPSGVVISSVGTYADPFVEIENNSSYEMSLNKWILKGSVHSFLIPEGMVILPNKKLKLSPKITGFDFNDLNSISIIDTSGQVFATYPKQKTYSTKNYSISNSQSNIVKADIVASDQVAGIANSPDVINLNDLGANAVGAGSTGSANNGLNNKTLIYLGLAGIIIIGIVSVVLIRHKVDYPDYMEKEISAKDMTIIE